MLRDFQLIDLEEQHRWLLLNWRNAKEIRENMYHDEEISREIHSRWFDHALKGDGIIAKLLTYHGVPVGFVNFTHLDERNNRCYWGFYIGEKNAPRGTGTALGILALSYIFESYHLRKLCAEVLAFNEKSLRFHKKMGFQEEGVFKKHIYRNQQYIDVVALALFREDWPQAKAALL